MMLRERISVLRGIYLFSVSKLQRHFVGCCARCCYEFTFSSFTRIRTGLESKPNIVESRVAVDTHPQCLRVELSAVPSDGATGVGRRNVPGAGCYRRQLHASLIINQRQYNHRHRNVATRYLPSALTQPSQLPNRYPDKFPTHYNPLISLSIFAHIRWKTFRFKASFDD